MNRKQDEPFDRDQPTLIVTYGNTTQKYRPLDRDVLVLGRAANCDLNLLAAEVAPIHCLLLRCPGGSWRVRHFGGRIGTLVNGKRVQDAVVDHDDTLQIGSFSFKVYLPLPFRRPGLKNDVPPNSVEASHLRRSRRNLVRLALNFRARCHEKTEELERAEQRLEQQEQDLDALRNNARARQQALDALRLKHEAEERDFLARYQALEQQEATLRERLRLAVAAASPAEAAEEAQRLEQRCVELAHYARHLRRAARKVAEREAELVRKTRELARERDQLTHAQEEPRRLSADNPTAAPTLSERLSKVQKLKKGLAMLRTSDSAPGISKAHLPVLPHQTTAAEVVEQKAN